MIATIRIVGIAALLLAGLMLTFWAVSNSTTDLSLEAMPTAFERFKQRAPGIANNDDSQTSPLIRQARAFAAYLNPPPVLSSPQGGTRAVAVAGEPIAEVAAAPKAMKVQPASSSPKFELHGISFYRSDPDQSMAMICEPGGARRWVRAGDEVGHIVIERIENDGIVYRDGVQSQTMALASSEVITGLAQKMDASPKAPKPSSVVNQGAAAPIPVRGLRQMPRSRVAAKLSLSAPERTPPGQRGMEAQ